MSPWPLSSTYSADAADSNSHRVHSERYKTDRLKVNARPCIAGLLAGDAVEADQLIYSDIARHRGEHIQLALLREQHVKEQGEQRLVLPVPPFITWCFATWCFATRSTTWILLMAPRVVFCFHGVQPHSCLWPILCRGRILQQTDPDTADVGSEKLRPSPPGMQDKNQCALLRRCMYVFYLINAACKTRASVLCHEDVYVYVLYLIKL